VRAAASSSPPRSRHAIAEARSFFLQQLFQNWALAEELLNERVAFAFWRRPEDDHSASVDAFELIVPTVPASSP
jgi:hypothetical protein